MQAEGRWKKNGCGITRTANRVDTENRAKESAVSLVVVVGIFISVFCAGK